MTDAVVSAGLSAAPNDGMISRKALKGYVSFTGTVTTGPVDVSCLMLLRNKYV